MEYKAGRFGSNASNQRRSVGQITRKHRTQNGNQPTGKGTVIKYFTTFTNTIADVLASRGWKEVVKMKLGILFGQIENGFMLH